MILPNLDDTICALSTPEGMGALAIIRLSGKDSFSIISKVFSKDNLAEADSHTAHFGLIRDGDKIIDEVVAVIFKGPNSFTGEDTVEISCHGSVYIQREVFNLLISNGARLAQPGEYTMRAYLNGKMDLSSAEAVTDLISSESAASHRVAMDQMRGGFSHEISEFRSKLIDFASLIELELDFSEEDVEFADRDQFISLIVSLQKRTKELIHSFSTGNAIKTGVPVAIIGSPNSGKSTLLNSLLNENKAIVSNIAGTTRDAIEDTMDVAGIMFRFIDTAGIRDTEDTIEGLGIERAIQKAKEARIVLLLLDVNDESFIDSDAGVEKSIAELKQKIDLKDKKFIVVYNKVDLKDDFSRPNLDDETDTISISAKSGLHVDLLKDLLSNHIKSQIGEGNKTMVTNIRHHQVLKQVDEALTDVHNGLLTKLTGDLLAIDIRKALFHLGEITGETTTDDLLGNIFSRFCIGK